jgi:hypothetical protein
MKTGRPPNILLASLTVPCKSIEKGKPRYRCALGDCKQSWGGMPQKSRVYKHILNECASVDEETKATVREASADQSLNAQITQNNSLESFSKAAAKEQRKLASNQTTLNLICGLGLPPTIVDSPLWDEHVLSLDTNADIYSSTTFVDTYIPAEATRITNKACRDLSKMKNLTLGFDGGTTAAVESIYTFHVTTGDTRVAYLIEGSEASGESHTGEHIATEGFKVCLSLIIIQSY